MNADAQSSKTTKKASIYVSLRWKILLGFTLIFSVVFAVAFYWFYQFATTSALTRIEDDLTSTLLGSAAGVNTDELLALSREGTPNSDGFSDDPRYQGQLNWLDTIHKIEPRAWPYLYIPGSEPNQIIYVVDLWARYDVSRATPFLYTKISKGFSLGGLQQLTLRTVNGRFDTYTDEWGNWASAYAPIKDKSGKIIGAIGIDFEANYVDQVRQSIIDSVAYALFLTYTSLFILVFLVSGAVTDPIVKLTHAAKALGDGSYSQDFSDLNHIRRFNDEIEQLSLVFTVMADKVYKREQTLKHQVEVLLIEIDETKRNKQVSEIADSDFFKELKNKAYIMRTRRDT